MPDYNTQLKRYGELVAAAGLERKGKTMPYTSSNGYMFSLVNKDGEIGIRLPKDQQNKLRDLDGLTEFRSHGAVMRDYVCLSSALLEDDKRVISLLKDAYTFVHSLPPK